MKLRDSVKVHKKMGSQPARAVWIEIDHMKKIFLPELCHSLRGLCGLKWPEGLLVFCGEQSQPARAVWIEITGEFIRSCNGVVTACEDCVGLNYKVSITILSTKTHIPQRPYALKHSLVIQAINIH